MAKSLADDGDFDQAQAAAESIDKPDDRGEGLASVARALATAGDPERSQSVAESIGTAGDRAAAFTAVANALADIGDQPHARRVAERAVRACAAIDDPSRRTEALADAARALAGAGDQRNTPLTSAPNGAAYRQP